MRILRWRRDPDSRRDRHEKRKGGDSSKGTGYFNALLGKDTEFEGKIRFHGAVRIDGKLTGQVETQEGILIVGETGNLKAEIRSNTVIIAGEVNGNVQATGRIEIHSSGRLFGNIRTPVLIIDKGAVFEGTSHMTGIKESVEDGKEPLLKEAEIFDPISIGEIKSKGN